MYVKLRLSSEVFKSLYSLSPFKKKCTRERFFPVGINLNSLHPKPYFRILFFISIMTLICLFNVNLVEVQKILIDSVEVSILLNKPYCI